MKFTSRTAAVFCSMLPLFSFLALADPGRGACRPHINTPAYYARMVQNYVGLWAGDYSLLNATLSPVINFSSDRFPTANGTADLTFHTAAEFRGFVERARTGWSRYGFEVYKSAAADYNIFIRWRLEAIVGPNFPPQLST